jgi:hypothetical protein
MEDYPRAGLRPAPTGETARGSQIGRHRGSEAGAQMESAG